ncbi:G2-specific serine/threonine protein kinase [Irineochytrium annulatum]|nr:G2-specific serine/threonine protein kinase [Irineochytrium annulatum]
MEQYEPLEVIGNGSFGVIRKVKRKSDGQLLVRKEIDYCKMTDKEKRQLVAEVNILRELRHPNIVRYYERFVDRENRKIHIVMEFCEGGDLAVIIRKCKRENKQIPEDVIWNLLSQLLLALNECHNGTGKTHPTVLHRDIKPDNVFLDGAQNVKLGDFGLSRVIENPELEFAKTYVGTPFYMSPEIVNESAYNTKSDVWALGCLIYELCTLEPPFQAKTQAALSAKIRQGRFQQLPSQYSDDLNYVIRAMLTINQAKRPSANDVLKCSRVRLCLKERELSAMKADLHAKLDDVRKREQELDAREAALVAREEALRRRSSGAHETSTFTSKLHDVENRQSSSSESSRNSENATSHSTNSTYVMPSNKSPLEERTNNRCALHTIVFNNKFASFIPAPSATISYREFSKEPQLKHRFHSLPLPPSTLPSVASALTESQPLPPVHQPRDYSQRGEEPHVRERQHRLYGAPGMAHHPQSGGTPVARNRFPRDVHRLVSGMAGMGFGGGLGKEGPVASPGLMHTSP